MSAPSHLDTIGPDHHAEMEAHYATGRELSEALMRVEELELERARLLGFARAIPLFTDDKGVIDLGTLKRMWFYAYTGLDEPVGDWPWGKLLTRVDGMAR